MIKPHTPVKVIWEDAWSDRSQLATPEQAETFGGLESFTIGFMLANNKSGVSLGQTLVPEINKEEYRSTFFIPKGMIKKIVVLK